MTAIDILVAILGLSILVTVHEYGHYIVACRSGMRVLKFSIGFGPAIWKFRPKGSSTQFQIGIVPFLAYVQIAGMNPQDKEDPNDPALFQNRSWLARAATIAGGPAANYLAASLLAFGLAVTGWPEDVAKSPMTVGELSDGFPAQQAGLQVGDVILQADGRAVENVEDLIEVTSPRGGQPTEYLVERDGVRLPVFTIVPNDNDGRGVIGVVPQSERRYVPMPLWDSTKAAVMLPIRITAAQIAGIGDMMKRGSTEGLTGPVGMTKIVSDQAHEGPAEYVRVLILLSVALGMFNLLPFPALDGGRLVFLFVELVTRKRPNERLEALVHTIGIVFLLSMLVLVTFRDIVG